MRQPSSESDGSPGNCGTNACDTAGARSGFDINQLASEYRALRASVLRLWTEAYQPGDINLEDVIRFNEAIDQALANLSKVARAHGGEIHVRSDSAVTVFAVRLPRHNHASSP